MTRKEIISEKLKRLITVPDNFIDELSPVEKAFNKAALTLISQLEQNAQGQFIINKRNLALLAQIETELKKVFLSTDYIKITTDFIKEFDKQSELSNKYFQKTFPESTIPQIASDVLTVKKKSAIDLLLNDAVIEAQFVNPVKLVIEQGVTAGATFTETLNNLQLIITGNEKTDSKIMQYSKQVAYDSFAVTDAAYMQTVAESINAEWYLYQGGEVADSRAFCIERHGHYYHKKEVEAWGAGKKTTGLETPDSTGHWQGEMKGTNAQTIFQTRGGYNCKHQLMPVSIFIVPKSDIEKAIQQGYYSPSDYEIKKIGLN